MNRLFTNKALKALIIPLVLEQVLVIAVGMADTMMVSSAGEAAVSGVSLVDMINVMIINLFAALATGGAVICSQFLGLKNRARACEAAKQLTVISLLFALFTAALAISLRKPLLSALFGQIEPEVMSSALIYLIISALSYPFLAVYNAGGALFRVMGNSKITLKISVLMNVINLIFNSVFIFGFRMGAAGAAAGSLIARIVSSAVMLRLIMNRDNEVYIDASQKFRFNMPMIKNILRIGIPNGFENSLFQLGRVLVVSIISTFGTVQIAANAVANNLDGMGCIAGQAMNLAMVAVVGRCVGAGDDEQTVYYIKKLMKIAYVAGFIMNAVIIALMPLFFMAYNLSDETLALARTLVLIHNGCAILLWPASFVLPNALRAASDVKFTMIVSLFSMAAFRILLSWIIGYKLGCGAIGVWIAMIVDWIFRVIMFVSRAASGKWKGKCFVR